MMDRQRELSIERYLSGKMTPSEEDDFLRRIEADPKLRAMLGTDRAIRASMLTDRNAILADHTRTRERMMGLAVATPSSVELLGKSGVGKKMSGGMKAFVATMICIAVTTGALLLAPSTADRSKSQPQTKSETIAPAKPTVPSSAPDQMLAPPQTNSIHSVSSRPDVVTPVTAERSKMRQTFKLPTADGSRESNRKSKIQNPKSPNTASVEAQPKKKDPVTITDKRLRTRVNIEVQESKP